MAGHTYRWYLTRFVVGMCAAAVTYYAAEHVIPAWLASLPKPLPEVLVHPMVEALLEVLLAVVYGLIAWIGFIILGTSIVICTLYGIISYILDSNLYVSIAYGLWAGATLALFITSLNFFIDAPWEEGYDNEEFGPDPGGVWPFIMILQFLLSLATLLFISMLHGIIAWAVLEGRRGWVIFISAITFIIGATAIALSGGRNRRYPGNAGKERPLR